MGIENFVVTLDNPAGVFYAGQILSGTVKFVISKPTESDGVFIKYIGVAEVHWTEQRTTGTGDNRRTETVHYRSQESYFDQKFCLYSPPGRVLQPWNYSFPFSFQLPPHIPSSFIGTVGKISYMAKANVHRSGAFKMATNFTLPFSVVGIKDLNYFPMLKQMVSVNNHKTFGALFWKSKPLTAEISINKQAFVSGENIFVSGLINNESNVKIKYCELKLKKHVVYYARGGSRQDNRTVYECRQPEIDKSSKANWSNVPVFVPCLPPSGLDGCQIITTSYQLEIRIVPPGVHFALELYFNITIGTIPYIEQAPMPAGYAPPPMPGASGAGYAPPPMLGASGAGYAPPPGATQPPPYPTKEGANPEFVMVPPMGGEEAGPLPPKDPSMSPAGVGPSAPPQYAAPGAPPGAPLGAPPGPSAPPYMLPGPVQPTFGEYCSDSSAPPAYSDLFKGADDNAEHDDTSRNYQPKYPSFNFGGNPPPK